MAKLLLFAVCEKVVVDQRTNLISLTNLLQDVNVQIPEGAALPENAVVPMEWQTVSIFRAQPGDAEKTFEQRVLAFNREEKQVVQTPVAPFEIKEQYRIISAINGMPVGVQGLLSVRTFLREKGQHDWTQMGEYPINIKWQSISSTIH